MGGNGSDPDEVHRLLANDQLGPVQSHDTFTIGIVSTLDAYNKDDLVIPAPDGT